MDVNEQKPHSDVLGNFIFIFNETWFLSPINQDSYNIKMLALI